MVADLAIQALCQRCEFDAVQCRFGLQDDIMRLTAAAGAPFLPLLLTVWSPEELILHLIKVVF